MSANSDSSLTSAQLEAVHMVDMPAVAKALGRKVYKHSRLETVIPGQLYVIQGRFPLELGAPTRLNLTYITRTMTIVREKDGLTLINGITLSENGYAELETLGNVKNVVRLGSFHGADDVQLLTRFKADYWVLDGMELHDGLAYLGLNIHTMGPESKRLPVAESVLFTVPESRFPEGLLLLPYGDGVLVTVDSLTNFPKGACNCGAHTSFLMQASMSKMGMLGPGKSNPPWLESNFKAWGKDEKKILPTFYRNVLFRQKWDTLITGHGPPLMHAKEQVRATLEKQFLIRILPVKC